MPYIGQNLALDSLSIFLWSCLLLPFWSKMQPARLQQLEDKPGANCCHRIFYYPGAKFDISLLIQAFIMIAIQLVLLKVALDHRPSPSSKGGEAAIPFAASRAAEFGISRPYNFWQWRSPKPYVSQLILQWSFPSSKSARGVTDNRVNTDTGISSSTCSLL